MMDEPESKNSNGDTNGDLEDLEEADPKVFCLSFADDRHPTSLLHSLNMMRKNRTFCDVVLHVGNSELHGHRAVLGSVSPHLFELFTTDDDKGIRETVISYKLNGAFEKAALDKLIDYAYTAKLELSAQEVKSVFVAATQLKMARVAKECASFLVHHLSLENCLEIRSLPGIPRDKQLLQRVDSFISSNFENIRQTPALLALPCVRIEVLSLSGADVAEVGGESVCLLALDWVRRCRADYTSKEQFMEKTHLLYLAMDNSLQDCSELPPGEASDTELVQEYRRLSKSTSQKKTRKGVPAPKPRVIIYNRDIPDTTEQDRESDWRLLASCRVLEGTFVALVTMEGSLGTLSVMLRPNLNQQGQGPSETFCGLAVMGKMKCGAGCANLNEQLFVCGGYDRAECLRSVELYSPSTNAWASLAPMLEARGRFNIAVIDGCVYAVGGCNGTTELATVERYSVPNRKWERIASLPMARSNTGVCALDEKIYCIGGWNGQVGIRQCDVFDPKIANWEAIPPLGTGRYQAGVTSMHGKVWVVGGCDGWNCLNTVEVYSPEDRAWTYSKNMITPRRGCGVALFKGMLYIVGGSDGTQSLATTEIFNPEDSSWTVGPPMSTPRSNVGVAVIGGRLYAVGGFNGKTFLNSIEFLDESTDEWTTFSPFKLNNPPDSPNSPESQTPTPTPPSNSTSFVFPQA